MGRGRPIVVALLAAVLAAPATAAAHATPEERAFAAAVVRFDGAVRAARHDPAVLAAVRARQQAGRTCLDSASAAAAAPSANPFDPALLYLATATVPLTQAFVPAFRAYAHELLALRFRDRDLRSVRAVLLTLVVRDPSTLFGTPPPSDFCTPLRAWQAAGFADEAEPRVFRTTRNAVLRAPEVTPARQATLRLAVPHLRAAGVPLPVRARFAAGPYPDSSALFRDDPVLDALGVSTGGP